MSTSTLTLADARQFVRTADLEDLETLQKAILAQRKMIQTRDAAMLGTGDTVTLHTLSPKFLNGSTGVLSEVRRSRADVILDKDSTDRLRRQQSSRFYVPTGTENYLLRGVPMTCCKPTD